MQAEKSDERLDRFDRFRCPNCDTTIETPQPARPD
jgi:hypothetical protein